MSRLTHICIHDLRNLTAVDLQPHAHINVLTGQNGSGKTSFLEAIYLLATSRSFRSHLTSRIIQQEKPAFHVHAKIEQPFGHIPVGLSKNRDGNTQIKVSGESASGIISIAELLPVQLLYPDSHTLITGGPKCRRQFMDWGVFHLEPSFFAHWQRAERIIKQRNALLRQQHSTQDLIIWNRELCQVAEILHASRERYFEFLIPKFERLLTLLLPDTTVKLNYYRGWQRETELAELLDTHLARDKELGYTTVGPHRADLKITTNNTPAKDILSQGQQKAIVYALRLAQSELLHAKTHKQSLYLIDDLPAELDAPRRAHIAEHLINTQAQIFVTGTDPDQLSTFIKHPNTALFHVHQGIIVETSCH